jgi:hypothetical protein
MIMKLDIDKVQQVYSGRPGCACGCRGTYKAPNRMADQGMEVRGYAFDAEDISDRSVKTIVGKVERIANGELGGEIDMVSPVWISANSADGSRTYTVYFTEPQQVLIDMIDQAVLDGEGNCRVHGTGNHCVLELSVR